MGAVQYVAACFGYLPAARAERAGIRPPHQFPICGGDSSDLLTRPDLEHPWYSHKCTMHNLPVYSIELLNYQYPSRGQFFPCEVFVRVIPNATSRVRRHFLFSCPHADCLEGECLLLGEIVLVLAEEYSLCAKICRAVQLRLP